MDSAGYENAQVTGTISDSLIKSLRFLILAISATSLAVLFYLSQRSGAYQTGVLRAIGVKTLLAFAATTDSDQRGFSDQLWDRIYSFADPISNSGFERSWW
jgi:hypothetical protein